ncbi:MAG: hypothetical protein Q9162_002066 [Coniocarpon cinnabarinum]
MLVISFLTALPLLTLAAALPQSTSTDDHTIFSRYVAYPLDKNPAGNCPDASEQYPNPDGWDASLISTLGNYARDIEKSDQFWFSAYNSKLLIGLFDTPDCKGNYRKLYVGNYGSAETTDAGNAIQGCVTASSLPGTSQPFYECAKILALCDSNPDGDNWWLGCDWGDQ